MWSGRIPSVYITHQLMIKAPQGWSFIESMLYNLHCRFIKHFDECWVPDLLEDGGLSGDLAHKRSYPVPVFYIGPQSRFKNPAGKHEKNYDIMAILSGPEPQRSIFERLLLNQLSGSSYRSILLAGKPDVSEKRSLGRTEVYSHMPTSEMQKKMLSAKLIICRPGYSSIMDIATLGCKAAFVPTPGQTEQEYLGFYHMEQNNFHMASQKNFDIVAMVLESGKYSGLKIKKQEEVLNKRLEELLARL